MVERLNRRFIFASYRPEGVNLRLAISDYERMQFCKISGSVSSNYNPLILLRMRNLSSVPMRNEILILLTKDGEVTSVD